MSLKSFASRLEAERTAGAAFRDQYPKSKLFQCTVVHVEDVAERYSNIYRGSASSSAFLLVQCSDNEGGKTWWKVYPEGVCEELSYEQARQIADVGAPVV